MDASTSRPGAGASFEITRVFQAPRSRVWDAWSDGALFGQWWGPKGCAVQVSRFEFRPGGLTHYAMQFDGAPPMWGRFSYREVTPQQRIVWLNAFANDRCGIARAPFSELCPLEIENTATFSEQAGATTILLRAVPFGASPEEVGFFAELCNSGSLAQGYGGTFDQLAEHLG